MESASNPPADARPGYSGRLTYILLSAAIGATASILAVFIVYLLLNPTIITQADNLDDLGFSLTVLGGFNMLICGPIGCLAGLLVAPLPSLVIANRLAGGRLEARALFAVMAVAAVVGLVAGVVTQLGLNALYTFLFPCGLAGQFMSCQ